MVGEIAAGAGDPGGVGARRMQPGLGRRMDQQPAPPVALVMRLAEEVFDRLLGVFQRARPAFDKAREVPGNQGPRQRHRMRFAEFLGGIFGKGAG